MVRKRLGRFADGLSDRYDRIAANSGMGACSDIGRLARLLIARHLRIAIPDSAVRDRLVAMPEVSYDAELVERDMRCIAVVGAGASVPLLDRSDDLATELEAQFGRDEAELERLQLVNNLESDTFETRLVALSSSPAAERRVREEIAKRYAVRYPSLLGYELIAHLLKHRFFDAIVSFNFDELLDQSLDDELDRREYAPVVSERDCSSRQTDPNASGYLPLYVKLHGTANEPESLRFTPQSYYAIPPRISELVRDLLHCEHCVIANIGSNLGSFDFQRLLSIPQQLDVFNLSYLPIPETVRDKIDRERKRAQDERHRSAATRGDAAPKWLHDCSDGKRGCNELVSRLTSAIEVRAKPAATPKRMGAGAGSRPLDPLVDFRSALRHKALAQLLGCDTVQKQWIAIPAWATQQRIVYCRRRTILELALAGAKARGLMSLGPLASDRPGRYYDTYKELTDGQGDDWSTLCSAAGLSESERIPDILLSQETLRKPSNPRNAEWQLNEFEPRKLAQHVLARIKNPYERADLEILATTIDELQRHSDVEFHMRDDQVCSKAFKRPMTLPTSTSLRAYTSLLLDGIESDDEIHISAETGGWLLQEAVFQRLSRSKSLRVLLAFDIERPRILERYQAMRIDSVVIDPWRHNRHMTIVCKQGRPTRAIYFARRLRAPVITAVYLDSIRDVQSLMQLYELRWNEAEREEQRPLNA